jgi:N-acetylmuramoyl-L-alanine amidase
MSKFLKLSVIVSVFVLGSINANAETNSCTSNDCKHIAEAIYHEARGEGEHGMIAVANVIMNRSVARKKSPAQVVQEPGQFSYRGRRGLAFTDKSSYDKACSIANGVMTKKIKDNTHGATYFRSGGGTWGRNFKQTVKIKNHVFFKPVK